MAGLKIEELRKPADGGMYYSDVEICVDKDGNIVEAGSVASVRMIVGAGSCIPMRVAEKYGLIGEPAVADASEEQPPQAPEAPATSTEEPAEKAQKPQQNKARKGFRNK